MSFHTTWTHRRHEEAHSSTLKVVAVVSIYPTITRLISSEGKDMRISVRRIGLTWLALALSAQPKAGTAAEIKALMSIGVQSVIEDLAPKFEKASGHRLVSVFGLSAPLSR